MNLKEEILSDKSRRKELWIKKHHPAEYVEIIKLEGTWREKLCQYVRGLAQIPRCPICGKPVHIISISKGFHKYCSNQCRADGEDRVARVKKLKYTYSLKTPGEMNKIKEKRAETNKKLFGTENPFSSEEIKEKIKQINIERYGTENPFSSEKIKKKIKQTNLDRYGVEYPAQSEEIKKKCIQTNIERYGVPYPSQNKDINERAKNTKLQKYGDRYYNNREKCINTNMKRYGVPYYSNPQKIKETNMERYGVSVVSMAKPIKKKMITGIHKNNVERVDDLIKYTKDGDWMCKCPHPDTCGKCIEKYYITSCRLYYNRKQTGSELCTRLLPIQPLFSTYELQVRSWLDDLNIEYISNDRSIISSLELDIYIPGNHLAIEINGCYWHSSACKSKSYHMEKWSQCKEKGIKMITLWEDWIHRYPENCKQLIMYHLGMIKDIEVPWDRNLVDLGLGSGSIKEHLSDHDGYECWDCGLFQNKII